ncbi:hypothetical protein KDK95_31595 [Actinospica sp. MGRD01-02]|uniref:Uncharacterized protein n=1 Tax=Actinospica acidithermotolerans TaxID=2828514 RepID=A0A941IPY4_9ACTN|nr:hypothetical protein [Actinospica acidithermotolerans]MBR7830891.1 hypothetical protein [Actinospica acidithermotolerans]
MPVPYIAAWSGEITTDADLACTDLVIRTNLVTGGKQVRYTDERPEDRDTNGVLWHRVPDNLGRGEPHFAKIHTGRQRRAMDFGLCQVCAGPAQVWMTTESMWQEYRAVFGPAAVSYPTFDPPVCLPCAEAARAYCPAIGRGHLYLATRAWATTLIRAHELDPVGERLSEVRTLRLAPPGAAGPDPDLLIARALGASLIGPVVHRDPTAVPGLGRRVQIAAPSPTAATPGAPRRPRTSGDVPPGSA